MTAAPAERERVSSLLPFTVRRRITWGECDAAGVVYTPRYGDIAAETNQLFLAHVMGAGGLMQGKRAHGIGTPCRALQMAFHASLRPDDLVDITVHVLRLGRTSIELATRGRTPKGGPVFEATTTLVTVQAGSRSPLWVPDALRNALAPHLFPEPEHHGR